MFFCQGVTSFVVSIQPPFNIEMLNSGGDDKVVTFMDRLLQRPQWELNPSYKAGLVILLGRDRVRAASTKQQNDKHIQASSNVSTLVKGGGGLRFKALKSLMTIPFQTCALFQRFFNTFACFFYIFIFNGYIYPLKIVVNLEWVYTT